MAFDSLFNQLRLRVLERGWLSSNNVVFSPAPSSPAAVVDTGYEVHALQTVELIKRCLPETPLARILNTHLHSDHCGGNAALQRAFGSETAVPAVSFDAVSQWNRQQLTHDSTSQSCERFAVHLGLEAGSTLILGGYSWQILEAPGHDADALMFFEPESRVLISGDALWESRLAIVFPALDQLDGFSGVEEVLGVIGKLNPSVVIPGHGRPFSDVPQALASSLRRLRQFQVDPTRHLSYAMRALTMFHMLEVQQARIDSLILWMLATPIFRKLIRNHNDSDATAADQAGSAILEMVASGVLRRHGDIVSVDREKSP